MNKNAYRILAILGVAFVLLLSFESTASASGIAGDLKFNTYYAMIPYQLMAVNDGSMVFNYAAQGQTYMRTSQDFDREINGLDPAYLSLDIKAYGWYWDAYDSAELVFLNGTYSQMYYSNPSNYYATTNEWFWDLPIKSVSMFPSGFGIPLESYDKLAKYAYLTLPAGVSCTVTVSATYYSLSDDGSQWERHVANGVKNIVASAAGNYTYYPERLFQTDYDYPGSCVPVDQFSISIEFTKSLSANQHVSFGMLYGNHYDAVEIMASKVPTKETVKTEYIEIAAEDLDLWSWMIRPVLSFFDVEIFPGISIGGVAAVGVGICLVLIYLTWFK